MSSKSFVFQRDDDPGCGHGPGHKFGPVLLKKISPKSLRSSYPKCPLNLLGLHPVSGEMILVMDPDAEVSVYEITPTGELVPYGTDDDERAVEISNWGGITRIRSTFRHLSSLHLEEQDSGFYENLGRRVQKMLRFSSSGEVHLAEEPPVSEWTEEDFVPLTPSAASVAGGNDPAPSGKGKEPSDTPAA